MYIVFKIFVVIHVTDHEADVVILAGSDVCHSVISRVRVIKLFMCVCVCACLCV